MVIIELKNIDSLNTSLQVGDAVYATPTDKQSGAEDKEASEIGKTQLVGILRKIEYQAPGVSTAAGKYDLYVDEQLAGITSSGGTGYIPKASDFLMFSKYSQESGEIAGYYARAKFINNSRVKAEIFAVSSEVIINSK